MCMEDIEIGRYSRGNFIKGVATTAMVQFIGGNPHRTALYFSGPGVGGGTAIFLTFSPDPTSLIGQGITTANFGPGQLATIEDFGEIITHPWYVSVNTGTANFAVFEKTLYHKEK